MSMMFKKILAVGVLSVMPVLANANPQLANDPAAKAVLGVVPNVEITAVEAGPIRGWKTVTYNASSIAYVIDGGKHVVLGNVVRTADNFSYTVASIQELRADVVANLPANLRLTYAAANQQAEINVFTDVSCSFCLKFHRESLPALNAAGVTVHYYPAPRGGRASPVYPTMRDIWCSADPKASLSAYINNPTKHAPPALNRCAFDISKVEVVTSRLGMVGTPGVYTMRGEDLGGAAPPTVTLNRLGLVGPGAAAPH